MRHFSPVQLVEHLRVHSPLLLDVREPWEFSICKLDNSQLIPMRQIPSHIHAFESSQEIVVICHHGIRSKVVCDYMEQQLEFNQLINLSGGVNAWAQQIDPAMARY